MKYIVVHPDGFQVAGSRSMLLTQAYAITQEIRDQFSAFDSGRDGSTPVQSLALEVFFTHNTFAVTSDMLPAFLDLKADSDETDSDEADSDGADSDEADSDAATTFQIRTTIKRLVVHVYCDMAHQYSNHKDNLIGLLECPKLQSLQVKLRGKPKLDICIDYFAELATVRIWKVLEALKKSPRNPLTVSMTVLKPVPHTFPVVPWAALRLGLPYDSSRILPSEQYAVEVDEDISWMWEAPTDETRNKYLASQHNWMQELAVLMFDQEANKEARLECDTEALPLSEQMEELKARPKILDIMHRGHNERNFRNSKLLTREAFALVRERFQDTSPGIDGSASVLSS